MAVFFYYTGAEQTWVVPEGVTSLTVEAQGASSLGFDNGPNGQRIKAILPVTPGELLRIYVGGRGTSAIGGWNGGGAPGTLAYGGQGASDIRQGGNTLAHRVIVGGGGGGYGANSAIVDRSYGGGGFLSTNGGPASPANLGGRMATMLAGGAGGIGSTSTGIAGILGVGGSGASGSRGGGGGGGGYYGGGGGGANPSGTGGGGGGGTSYAISSATILTSTFYPYWEIKHGFVVIDTTTNDLPSTGGWQIGMA